MRELGKLETELVALILQAEATYRAAMKIAGTTEIRPLIADAVDSLYSAKDMTRLEREKRNE